MTRPSPSHHQSPPPLLLALAGPTSSGKTTLATALSLIFSPSPTTPQAHPSTNPLTIVHADDFYLPDSKIPTLSDGTQDWDCAEALDVPRFHAVLTAIRSSSSPDLPSDLVRQGGLEDGADAAAALKEKDPADGVHGVVMVDRKSPISAHTIASLREKVQGWPAEARRRGLVLVEGIMLFSPAGAGASNGLSLLTELYDIRVLLRSTRSAAKRRREARNGYVTLEGFWQDPEGYFDRVVWPGFERVYGGLFLGGNVEGKVDGDKAAEMGVLVGPLLGDGDGGEDQEGQKKGIESVLKWIVELLGKALTGHD